MSDVLFFIGVCLYEPKRYSRVEPLVVAQEGAWRSYDDWTTSLPPEGRAFAPELIGYHKDDLVQFHVVADERGNSGRDQYLVSDPQRPIELLDFRAVEPEVARRTLVEEGVPRGSHDGRTVVVALQDGSCVVLTLEPHPDGKRYVASTEGLEELPVHALDPRVFDGDRINGHLFTVPGVSIGLKIGVVNWCLDADFLKAVLTRLRRAAGDGAPPFTRNQISQLVQFLGRAKIAPSNGEDVRALSARLPAFATQLAERIDAFDELVDTIAQLRPVADQLAASREAREAELRAELAPRIRTDLEAAHAELVELRDELIAETEALGREAEAARSEAAVARADLEAIRGDLSDELLAAQRELSGAASSSMATAREIGDRMASLLSKAPEIWPAPAPPWGRVEDAEGEDLAWSEFPARLRENAEQFGFAFEDLAFIDVAARAGRLVLLPESDAIAFVRCHAGVLAGESYVRHILDPSVLSADDLWRYPANGAPTPFAFAWSAAKLDRRRYRIVILDGLHRTPLDLWASSFVSVLDGPDRPENLLVFATFGSALLDPVRGWRGWSDAAVAVDPAPRARTNAEVLSAAIGRPTRRSRFDASRAERPAEAELLRLLSDIPADVSAAVVSRSLAAVGAAWPLAADLNLTLVARSIGAARDLPEGLRRGAEKARAVLDPSSP